jgi:acyl-coenzyme A thioesterase PaaI-like protein
MEPWTFGERALPEQERFAWEVRELCSAVLGLERPEPELDDLTELLRRARHRLVRNVPSGPGPRVGALADGDGRVYLDHGRDVGEFNPMFPLYRISVDGPEHATGTVRFPVCYEGPPGCVHGGFLAVFADSVVQHHNCAVGLTGKTRGLEIRYRRPAPVSADLDFEIDREVAEGSVTSQVRLTFAGELLCRASIGAVASDRTNLPAFSARR